MLSSVSKPHEPVTLVLKNCLFTGSHEAAMQIDMIYSFLGTCEINNVEHLLWLKDLI